MDPRTICATTIVELTVSDRDSLDAKFDALLRETARIDDVPAPTATSQLVGRTLGRFRILSLLGKGGMGVVYLAEDQTLHREVALKVVSPDAAADPDRRRRLLHEARAAAAVSHVNIAAVYEVGDAEGLLYIAMERVFGESLRERINRGPIPVDEATILAQQILDGLASAHDVGIVHRDLKPDNVMVDEQKRVKLLDFGLAKFWRKTPETTEPGTTPTEEGRLLGTPSYMSPEQAAGLALDARSDVFSFGVVFYEMVTGEQPFQGTNFLKILAAIERDEPIPISQKNPAVSPDLERIIQVCLEKEPNRRYPNARSVLEAFDKLDAALSLVPSVRMPRLARAPTSTPSTTSLSLHPSTPIPQKNPRRLLWPTLGVFALVFIVVGAMARITSNTRRYADSTDFAAIPREMSSASVAILPTVLTDLPPPTSTNADVLTAYKRSLAKYRAGDGWPETDLQRAVEIEPDFAPAYLRLAVNWTGEQGMVARKRANIQKAWEHSGRLSERDLALLNAFDPLFRTQPVNPAEYVRRMSALLERWPGDADLWLLRALGHRRNDDIEATIRDAQHARELDPRFAVAYSVLGQAQSARGNAREARTEYEACLKAIPTAAICMKGLILEVAMFEGKCKEVESLARNMLSINPDWFEAYLFLANALASRRDSLIAVEEATSQWEKAFDERAATTYKNAAFLPARKLENRAAIDVLAGNFEAAEKKAREALQIRASSSMLADHSLPSIDLIRILLEEGRPDAAAKLANDYLARSAAWEAPGKGIDFSRPLMLDFARHGHEGRSKSFAEQRDSWIAEASTIAHSMATGRHMIWYVGYAMVAHDATSAHEALAQLPKFQPISWSGAWPSDVAATGHAYLLDGHVDEALTWLEKATRHCRTLSDPIFHVLAYAWLGQAREKKGDKPGACSSYTVVLDHWGQAKPKSVTAEATRAHMKALGCSMR